jgi:hypothetical protein
MMITCLAALASLSAIAWAQNPSAPGQTPVSSEPLLPIPSVELGDTFADPEWGFEFRLPLGMKPLPPEEMRKLNETLSLAEEDRTAEDGTVGKLRHFQFRVAGSTANLLIRVLEPPARVESPSALRKLINEPDELRGRTQRNYGRLYRFRALDGRGGFFASRDFSVTPGTGLEFRQSSAYLLGATRSYIIQYTAKIEEFPRLEDDFHACLATFKIKDETAVTAKQLRPARKTSGFFSMTVIGNLVLGALLVLLLVRAVRGRSTAGTPSPS